MNLCKLMQLYSHAYHQLPASSKVTAIPYKLEPTIKTKYYHVSYV